MVRRKKTPTRKPRTLNAVWADAQCYVGRTSGNRFVHVSVDHEHLSVKQALRLSQWLAEAAAWKAEE